MTQEQLNDISKEVVEELSPRELIKDPSYLDEKLNVSSRHVELCERYGCSGLWTTPHTNANSNKSKTNIKLVVGSANRLKELTKWVN